MKKPATNSSREIRDNLLIEHFGFTTTDITEFDKLKPPFFIFDDSDKNKPATVAHVRSWKTNANGEVPISMPDNRIHSLIAFREQRALFEVFKVGMFIADATIRTNFVADLEKILTTSGEKRIAALNTLMMTIESSGASRYEIHQALRFLTNEAGYKNNPFLLIAFSRTTIYKSNTPSMGSNAFEQSMVTNAIKATNESLYNPSVKSALTKINKQEAAQINSWASELYSKSNAEEQYIQRKWIARWLSMSPEERDTYKEGEIVEILPPGVTVVETLSPAERELRVAKRKWQDRQKFEDSLNQSGSPRAPNVNKSEEIFQRPTDKFEMEDSVVRQKQRHTKDGGKRSSFKTVTVSNSLFRQPNIRVGGLLAPIEILNIIFTHIGANRRTNELVDYLRKRSGLLKQIEKEKRRAVPPKPETIKQGMMDVQRYGRTTADTFVKRNIPSVLRELEMVLEESNAYHK